MTNRDNKSMTRAKLVKFYKKILQKPHVQANGGAYNRLQQLIYS